MKTYTLLAGTKNIRRRLRDPRKHQGRWSGVTTTKEAIYTEDDFIGVKPEKNHMGGTVYTIAIPDKDYDQLMVLREDLVLKS